MIDLDSYDTDKSRLYLERYTKEFGNLYSEEITLLELGVQRGGSMYFWRDLFPRGRIAGLDLNPAEVDDDSGRIHLYRGFQQDPAVLDDLAADVAPNGFDIIVDDASHLGEYTRASFWHLFREHLKPGGVYAIDDWGCAYSATWADGHKYTGTRTAIGDFSTDGGSSHANPPGPRERLRRTARKTARPIASKVPKRMRPMLERLYMRIDGATIQNRFKSHDYGMAGVIKQLVDAAAIPSIDRDNWTVDNGIECIHVYDSQVFVHKRRD